MRCKGCDAALRDTEIYINEKTGQFEELCGECRGVAYSAFDEFDYRIDENDEISHILDTIGFDYTHSTGNEE